MTPLALTFLALVCSIFGTTSEKVKHDQNINAYGINPKLPHVYNNFKNVVNGITTFTLDSKDIQHQPKNWRHFNVNARNKKINKIDHNLVPDELYEAQVQVKQKLSNEYKNKNDVNKDKTENTSRKRQYHIKDRRKRETDEDPRCKPFKLTRENDKIVVKHPKSEKEQENAKPGEGTYTSNTSCFTTIEAVEGQVIELTFIDVFEIEYSPECRNDYLEIRDGKFGYARPEYRYCGKGFPPQITSTGPYLWLRFRSDEIIEYAGFTIEVNFLPRNSRPIDDSCYLTKHQSSDIIDGTSTSSDLEKCRGATPGSMPLDVQWKIETEPGSQIYLNITMFQLANPNNCSKNTVQIFGAKPDFDHLLGEYCSSVAKPLWTEEGKKINPGPANIMYIRLFSVDRKSNFSAVYTKFRTTDSCEKDEFNCKDGTCISSALRCDEIAHCRLKADEDPVECKGEAQSLVRDKDTRTILIVFSLILSGMVSVFLFKCIRKLYNDQKLINEYKAQFHDDLNKAASQLTLDPMRGCKDSLGLENEHFTNEMNRQMHRRRSSSVSMESDLLHSRADDVWPDSEPFVSGSKVRGRKTDYSRGQDSSREEERDLPTTVQEIQDIGCQTRDSLFQTAPILPATNGSKSGSNSRAVSGVAPRSPTPHLTVELLRQATAQDISTAQPDGRPLSTETTKSAPDVIQIY
ncbi:neuropilin and tolloid-like protein 2 isoform X2 [Leguminivora glycinivorella]|uniref:neuropilin and tolloid-like protein 2 isoform X2 n=1 Tax=Leguminivora glycinivorella TaxID=1035111 RepID=UPI00200E8B48|nr:neuropilin and tolloid-like protein 2 isoform X2 [Leguminivora glycinivorella]